MREGFQKKKTKRKNRIPHSVVTGMSQSLSLIDKLTALFMFINKLIIKLITKLIIEPIINLKNKLSKMFINPRIYGCSIGLCD